MKMKKINMENSSKREMNRKSIDLLKKMEYFNPALSSDRSYYSMACESFAEIYGKE